MTALYVAAVIAATVVIWVAFVITHRPQQPEQVSAYTWFQTLPARDFLPVVPRLPSVRRLLAPKRRGRHVA